jgi:hypothetical protein
LSKLIINKLILLGTNYKRTLNFTDGLNIIRGDRTSGKSLVLSLIDYCLGKSEKIELNVQKELDYHCDRVFIELRIDDETFTFYRLIKEKTGKIGVYFCPFNEIGDYIPKMIDIKETMQFIMRKLNISEYKRTKFKPHSTQQELETISFRDIFRFVYIKQHALGTDDFLENKAIFKRNKNPFAFEMIFNLTEPDKNQLQEELVNTRNNIDARNKEIAGLTSYLIERDAEDYSLLYNDVDSLNKKIDDQILQKETIIRQSNVSNISENKMYIKLKNRLTEIINQMTLLQRKKADIYTSLNSKKFLIEEYKNEKTETDATVEINYSLVISNQKIECPLCHSTVESQIPNEQRDSEKILHKVQKEIESKINLVNNMMIKDLKKIEEIDVEIIDLQKEQVILENAVTEFAKETTVPFLSQVDSINSIINNLYKEKEIINECLRVHRKIDEKNKLIADLEKEIERIQQELNALKISEVKKRKIFTFINEKYKSYMKRLKYNVNSDTYIDPDKYIPFYNGASVFDHESGGLLECMQISFLAAILSSRKEGYAVGHPGILLLDSISKYLGTIKNETDQDGNQDNERINDPEVYEEIYKILIELSDNNQIIIVDNTPPNSVKFYTKYTFFSGEKGLINLKANELENLDESED